MAFQEQQTLLIRSSLQTLLVLLDGEIIHSYDRLTQEAPRSPLASAWHLVRIPSHSDGKRWKLLSHLPMKACQARLMISTMATKRV